jgi:cell division protein FtsL
VIRGLPEHALLDRIVRGRAWIPLLGVLLVGIVAMQVEILKLGAGMGRWIQRSSALQTHNQALQASVAALTDDQRIERLAAKMGMVMPDPTTLSFLSAQPGSGAARAAANIHDPDPSAFTSSEAAALASPVSSTTADSSVSTQPSGSSGG